MAFTFPVWTKPGVYGAFVGAVGFAILGFSTDWIMTTNNAEDLAVDREKSAVVAALQPICVANFQAMGDAMQTDKLAALNNESSWRQGDYVEAQGWATMPGAEKPNAAVADACAKDILALKAG